MSNTKLDDGDTPSFPGYAKADEVFVSWANALRAQASGWNALWGKLRDGNAGFGDWSKLFVESVEATMAFSEQFWRTLGGSSAPPWVNLPFPPKAPVPVRTLKAVSVNDAIEAVPLTRLGGGASVAFPVQVSVVGPYDLKLFVNDNDWTTFEQALKLKANEQLQYVGLVFSREHPDPLAIVSFRVSAENVAAGQKARPPEIHELVDSHSSGDKR